SSSPPSSAASPEASAAPSSSSSAAPSSSSSSSSASARPSSEPRPFTTYLPRSSAGRLHDGAQVAAMVLVVVDGLVQEELQHRAVLDPACLRHDRQIAAQLSGGGPQAPADLLGGQRAPGLVDLVVDDVAPSGPIGSGLGAPRARP